MAGTGAVVVGTGRVVGGAWWRDPGALVVGAFDGGVEAVVDPAAATTGGTVEVASVVVTRGCPRASDVCEAGPYDSRSPSVTPNAPSPAPTPPNTAFGGIVKA